MEYENLKVQKEKVERSKQEQHLEATIEMRETIELLKEESLMKNELLSKYEKQQNKTDEEVSSSLKLNVYRLTFTKGKTRISSRDSMNTKVQ